MINNMIDSSKEISKKLKNKKGTFIKPNSISKVLGQPTNQMANNHQRLLGQQKVEKDLILHKRKIQNN